MNRLLRRCIVVLLCAVALPLAATAEDAPLPWQPFSPALFAQAKTEHKPVFLYLEAVWCHWCHVMQRTTFLDPGVQQRLGQQWLIARVDHDADPLLANRYRDFGWPALIFFNADGQEVAKRAGFLSAEALIALTDAILADSSPEQAAEGVAAPAPLITSLPDELRASLEAAHRNAYDSQRGSLNLAQKFIDRDSIEYALSRAAVGDTLEAGRARQSLNAASALIDPVWGGMYQYSTYGDWVHPHYEKIMRTQAVALRSYAMSYAQTHAARDLKNANAIRDYLLTFLRASDGGFYISQDADAVPGEKATAYFALSDKGRRRVGIPRVDTQVYAQENGLAIEALVQLYRAGKDADTLCAAVAAADWIAAHRATSDGRYRHGEDDDGGRYLGDTLYMGLAALALYGATGDAQWLNRAERAGSAIALHFSSEAGGYLTAVAEGSPVPPPRVLEENIIAARFYAALARVSKAGNWLADGQHALRWLAQDGVATTSLSEPGVLLAADELAAAEQR